MGRCRMRCGAVAELRGTFARSKETMSATPRSRALSTIRTCAAIGAAAALLVTAGCSSSPDAGTGDGDAALDDGPSGAGEDGQADGGDEGDAADTAADDFATSAEWAAAEYGEFETFTASGSGEEVVEVPEGIDSGIITVSQTEMIPASPDVLDDAGEPIYAIDVDHQAGEKEHVAVYMTDDDDSRVASIQMPDDAGWTVTIEPVSALPELPEENATAGAFLYDGPAGEYTFDGDMDVLSVVQSVPGDTLMVTDEPGVPGPLVDGPSIVQVIADAPWTASAA